MRIIASTIDITPVHPTPLAGYKVSTPFTAVAEKLEANIAVIRRDSNSDAVVIISLDLLYPGRIIRASIESAIPELKPEQIFLTASHTHQAPLTDDTKSGLGDPDLQYLKTLTLDLACEVRRLVQSRGLGKVGR